MIADKMRRRRISIASQIIVASRNQAESDEQVAQQSLLRLQLCHMGVVAQPIDVTQPPCMPDLLFGFDGLSDRLVGALLGVFDGLLGRRLGGLFITCDEQERSGDHDEAGATENSWETWASDVIVQIRLLRM